MGDGFNAAKKIKSDYFNIHIESGVSLDRLSMKLIIPRSIKMIIKQPIASYQKNQLDGKIDLLLLAVSEIMDIGVSNFNCMIKICRDGDSLSRVGQKIYGRNIKVGGFYVAETNTLYVDAESVSIHILGHELSHAIQAHYFVVPPPPKIQEVLAGYVEFQLRKYMRNLPSR